MRRLFVLVMVLVAVPAVAIASTDHTGWPVVAKGDKQINKTNANNITFTGHPNVHNELLGGNANDTLIAGNIGDILWGDYNPTGNGPNQTDTIVGGAGKDYIYASHGKNIITTGGGADQVHAHYGHGTITCTDAKPTIFFSHKSRPGYKIHGCKKISYKTVGY